MHANSRFTVNHLYYFKLQIFQHAEYLSIVTFVSAGHLSNLTTGSL